MTKRPGRPSKFPTIDLERVKYLVLKGFNDNELADFFQVNQDTWHEWKKVHPGFSESLNSWKYEYDHKIERSLAERAHGYSHKAEKIFCTRDGEIIRAEYTEFYPPDPTSMIFWLKNRKKDEWRDKREVEQSGETTVNHKVSHVDVEDRLSCFLTN